MALKCQTFRASQGEVRKNLEGQKEKCLVLNRTSANFLHLKYTEHMEYGDLPYFMSMLYIGKNSWLFLLANKKDYMQYDM